jgi:hypothetical protein
MATCFFNNNSRNNFAGLLHEQSGAGDAYGESMAGQVMGVNRISVKTEIRIQAIHFTHQLLKPREGQ